MHLHSAFGDKFNFAVIPINLRRLSSYKLLGGNGLHLQNISIEKIKAFHIFGNTIDVMKLYFHKGPLFFGARSPRVAVPPYPLLDFIHIRIAQANAHIHNLL
jgi:hypothetical protein